MKILSKEMLPLPCIDPISKSISLTPYPNPKKNGFQIKGVCYIFHSQQTQ